MNLGIRGKTYHVAVHQQRNNLPLLVMLHGFMGSGRVFDHLIGELKQISNPVTVDLLGHGKTDGDASPERFQTDEQVKDLHKVLSHFETEDIILHGYSMGGRLALQYALAQLDTISGLILESTTYGISGQQERQERQKLDEQRVRAIETDYTDFLNEWDHSPIFDNGIEIPASLKNYYKSIQTSQQPSQMANSLRGFGTGSMPPVKNELDKLNMPVLIMAGEADEKYRGIASEMQQNILNGRAVIIENAGHRVHLENPTAFVSEVQSFLLYCLTP